MVSPQRRFEKLQRMESKIMAYKVLLDTGLVPNTNEILNFHKSRWGQETMEMERIRAHQAMFDLKADITKNLEAMELTWKDYIKTHMEEDEDGNMVLTELGTVLEDIEDPSVLKKKEITKDAET